MLQEAGLAGHTLTPVQPGRRQLTPPVCLLLSEPVLGESHEVCLRGVPPVVPVRSVAHGCWKGESPRGMQSPAPTGHSTLTG